MSPNPKGETHLTDDWQRGGPVQQEWAQKWSESQTPWDLEGVTPALVQWSQENILKGQRILVPGCGGGHDAHFLSKRSAVVTAVDFVPQALVRAQLNYPQSRTRWLQADVTALNHHDCYDRIWEYTCFCALAPRQRNAYGDQIRASLVSGGAYWGMVFATVADPHNGPPFAVAPDSFKEWLAARFEITHFEHPAPHSVKARRGMEISFEARKA